MIAFHFPLERVLSWRRTQFEIEQTKYRHALAAVAELDRERQALEVSRTRAELQVRAERLVDGTDLAALGRFRRAVQSRELRVAERRVEAARTAEAQLQRMLEAQRRCRVLERLKDRRLAKWRAASE